MALSDDEIRKFKEVWKKDYGQDITDEEAQEYSARLADFFLLLMEIDSLDRKRKEKLKKFPKGFHVEGEGYTCLICFKVISNEETWYDAYGIKCLNCQRALDRK